jgi:broad specificity phosphatase PhoE
MDYLSNPYAQPMAYLIRHGETDLNAANCFRGWENPPLNESGMEAANQIASYLSYERIGRVVSSDLDRALQTAEAIMGAGNVVCPYVSPDFNLRPWGIAAFAGKEKTPENQKRLERYIKHPDLRIPDGESLNEFRNRQDTLLQYIANPYEGLPTVIVTHTSNLTHLAETIEDEGEMDPEVNDIVEPGGIVAVYLDTNGKMQLQPRLGAVVTEAEPQAS